MGDSLTRCIEASDITLQKEGAEVREGIDVFLAPDIPANELDAAMDIAVVRVLDELAEGGGRAISCFHFQRDEFMLATDEEIFFQAGIFFLIVEKGKPCFEECFGDHILIERSLVYAKVLVGTEVFLRFFVQRGDEQAGVFEINLEAGGIPISFEWKLREVQAVAEVHHAGIIQPLDSVHVAREARTTSDFCDLEFLVFLGELSRDAAEDREDLRLLQTREVLADVFLIVQKQLALFGENL